MDLQDLESGLRAVASAGHVLSCQELTGLQAGLSALMAKNKYQDIYFWGKIYGENGDYYIAYGLGHSAVEFPSKLFFYSGEDFEFRPLPRPSAEDAAKISALALDTPFAGSASTTSPELDRLTVAVQDIDFNTAVVPRGAHALNEAQAVVASSAFKGIAASEAGLLHNYAHLRPPASVAALKAKAHSDADFYSNFLDTLDADLLKGCWAVRQESSAFLVTLRSLTWPGYVAYHVPGTNRFGGAYFGFARKTRDLPFII